MDKYNPLFSSKIHTTIDYLIRLLALGNNKESWPIDI